MIDERRDRRADEIANGLMALCGANARVWWDSDSMLWRARWRDTELNPQSDCANERVVTTWRNEIQDRLMRS